jgi:hypothetical protein
LDFEVFGDAEQNEKRKEKKKFFEECFDILMEALLIELDI